MSRFDIAISLKHNNKIIRQYRAAPEQTQQEKRIAAICSEQFMQHAVFFETADQALKISGWVSDRLSPRPLADVQYCYINGRMIRDKLVNHAIRQVYAHFLPQGMFPGYIIYIECDAKEVDVNVHPAKHEVRFHQARWVHDFISSTLNATLSDSSLLGHELDENNMQGSGNQRVSEHAYQPPSNINYDEQDSSSHHNPSNPSNNSYQGNSHRNDSSQGSSGNSYGQGNYSGAVPRPQLDHQQVGAYCDFVAEAYQQNIGASVPDSKSNQHKTANVICMIDAEHLLIQPVFPAWCMFSNNGLLLMSLTLANKALVSERLYSAWQDGEVISQPLLLPVRFKLESDMLDIAQKTTTLLNRLGFTYKFQSQFVIVSQVPAAFRHAPIAAILPKVFEYLSTKSNSLETKDFDAIENNMSEIKLLCDQLSYLLADNQPEKVLSQSEIEVVLDSLIKLPTEHLQNCFKQPNLSLLLQGIQ